MKVTYMIVSFITLGAAVSAAPTHVINSNLKSGQDSEDDFEWLSCNEFMNHIGTVTRFLHMQSPKKTPGYSRKVCRQIMDTYKATAPTHINLIVNLSHHISQGRRVHPDEPIENYSERLRRRYRGRQLGEDPSGCDGGSEGAVYQMGHPGPAASTKAHPITDTCDSMFCPTVFSMLQPITCIPTIFEPTSYEDETFDAFEEFPPGYGGGGGYRTYTDSLQTESEWTGCDQDRVGDYNALALEFEVNYIIDGTVHVTDVVCETIDAAYEAGIFGVGVALPSPIKIGCAAVLTGLKIAELALNTIQDQIDFQNGLVDGAEIQAAYYHSMNLLDKQCSAFFEAVCRCSESGMLGAPGAGCDGLDSNCDGVPDDCSEDSYPPDIELNNVLTACSTGQWFQDAEEAQACVEKSLVVTDDCNGATFQVESGPIVSDDVNSCVAANNMIVSATDGCGNASPEVNVPVQIDDGLAPSVFCSVGEDSTQELVLGPGQSDGEFVNVNFQYAASDGCGLSNVKVEVYSNEYQRDDQAIVYRMDEDKYLLFVESGNCGNGNCIQDENLPDVRLYSIIVTATDNVGLESSATCFVKVVQKQKDAGASIEASVQRFRVLSWAPETN